MYSLTMNIYPLIFSNNSRYRLVRHIIFWTVWILYYTYFDTITYTKIPFQKAFFACLFEQILSTPIDMAFCYSIIYFLIPTYLYRGRYITMVLLWLLFSVLFILCFRLFQTKVSPALHAIDGLPVMMIHSYSFTWVFFELFSQINMEGCMAASIKLGKMWYIKQEENNLLKLEKQKAGPALLSADLKPMYLVNALDRVELLVRQRPHVIAGMVRKIKTLLLYAMYESNQPKTSLDKELAILKEYLDLEQEGQDGKLDIRLTTSGNLAAETIAPFIMLTLVENSLRQLNTFNLARKYLHIEIRLVESLLQIRLCWSKPVDTSTLGKGGNIFLQNIAKRLNLLYPQSHELKVVIKTEQFIVDCVIQLRGAVQ